MKTITHHVFFTPVPSGLPGQFYVAENAIRDTDVYCIVVPREYDDPDKRAGFLAAYLLDTQAEADKGLRLMTSQESEEFFAELEAEQEGYPYA